MPQNDIRTAAAELRQYLATRSPRLTGELRSSWRTNIGQSVATVFSRLPWAWRIRREANRARRPVLSNAQQYVRRRHPQITSRVTQNHGSITFTLTLNVQRRNQPNAATRRRTAPRRRR